MSDALEELMACPGSVGEAAYETPAAQAALVKILSLIPAVSGPESAAVPDLIAAVRELEFAVTEHFVTLLANKPYVDELLAAGARAIASLHAEPRL